MVEAEEEGAQTSKSMARGREWSLLEGDQIGRMGSLPRPGAQERRGRTDQGKGGKWTRVGRDEGLGAADNTRVEVCLLSLQRPDFWEEAELCWAEAWEAEGGE